LLLGASAAQHQECGVIGIILLVGGQYYRQKLDKTISYEIGFRDFFWIA
jgi:hypothetical protein